jgi:hypothetical protein
MDYSPLAERVEIAVFHKSLPSEDKLLQMLIIPVKIQI